MIHILLVDDHAILRQGTRQLLDNEPDMKVVGEAGDGEEAVRLACDLTPDVIILDVAMPKLNGVEATKRIKQLLPSTIILVLTGYDYDEYIFGLLEVGAAGYLLKDINGTDLVAAVRAVYNGEPVLHPTVARRLMDHCKEPLAGNVRTSPLENDLSEREMEVLKLAAKGISNKDIAETLFISVRTVQAHMRSIFNKLGIGSRSEAMIYGLKRGWFTVDDLPS
ncbi:MAG TPA: response regulator transcription factor [Dehalococcoidales bacterium]